MHTTVLFACLMVGCGGDQPTATRVIFTGETFGRLAACICDGELAGGLDYRRGFLAQQEEPYLLLDTGNTACGAGDGERLRAVAALEAMRTMGYRAMNLGEEEAALGPAGIAELAAVGLPLVSANLVDQSGAPVTESHVLCKLDGRRFVVTGLVDPAKVARPDLRAVAIDEALARLLPGLPSDATLIVLLDGRDNQARALADGFPEIDLILFRGYGESVGPERHNRSIIASVYGNRYIGDLQLLREAGRLPEAAGSFPELTAVYDEASPQSTAPDGISLSPERLEFGSFRRGESRVATLTVHNHSDAAVRIGRVYSPCTCFAMGVEEREIAAGGSAVIDVTLHSLELEGESSFPLFVAIHGAREGMLSVLASATISEEAP